MSHWTEGEPNCNKGDDGEWCDACKAAWQEQYRYWHAQWRAEKAREVAPAPQRESIVGLMEDLYG